MALPRLRWLLVHNCIHVGLYNCLKLHNPGLDLEAMDSATFLRDPDRITGSGARYDLVVTTPELASLHGDGFASLGPVFVLPLVVFEAYHPDLCIITADDQAVRGPMFDYHSRIVTQAHREGVPVARVRSLFNAGNFERLGYFSGWNVSKQLFLDAFSAAGLDLRGRFATWGLRTAFMHSIHHPAIRVIDDLSLALSQAVGLTPLRTGWLPADNMRAAACFPVYNEIAENLGIPGSYLFKAHGDYRFLTLDEFIKGSYETLSRVPADKMRLHPRSPAKMEEVRA